MLSVSMGDTLQEAAQQKLKRVLTALLLIPWLPLLALFWPHWLLPVWALLWLLCLWEWCALAGASRPMRLLAILLFIALAKALSWQPTYSAAALVVSAAAAFWLLIPFVLASGRWPAAVLPRLLLALPVLLPPFAAILLLYQQPWAFIYLLLLVWIADSGAWLCGHRWGRHKLAPAISPGKTMEGLAGAALAVVLLALLWPLAGVWSLPPLQLFLLSMLVLAVSVLGDLLESRAKRAAGRKDSGSLLPGHGGFLDRFDSMAAAAPVFACVLWWLN
ncbi:MAG: phosphatidate cytidylyltransferase [Candidatus Porifericomitaceae bacterium WSBS_2022_MAG_OTU9]